MVVRDQVPAVKENNMDMASQANIKMRKIKRDVENQFIKLKSI